MEQLDLAKQLGRKSSSSVSEWEKGLYTPKAGVLNDIAEIFGVSLSDLMQKDLKEKRGNTTVLESKLPYRSLELLELPLYGSVAAGALATIEGVLNDSLEHISIPSRFIQRYRHCKDLFAMIVNGDSMNKIIQDGSVVIAKPLELNQYNDGDIVIFSHNNDYSLKRYVPNDLEGFILFKAESTNPDFKDIPISKDTLDDLKIYGKVIFYGTTL